MAVTVKNIIPRKFAENTQAGQYTADADDRVVIDKFTITNTSALASVFSCNLVGSGDAAGSDNLVLKERTLEPGESYGCPELVGQSLEPGGFISTLASTASAIVISATGREIDII